VCVGVGLRQIKVRSCIIVRLSKSKKIRIGEQPFSWPTARQPASRPPCLDDEQYPYSGSVTDIILATLLGASGSSVPVYYHCLCFPQDAVVCVATRAQAQPFPVRMGLVCVCSRCTCTFHVLGLDCPSLSPLTGLCRIAELLSTCCV
jgi:hypothetical protein